MKISDSNPTGLIVSSVLMVIGAGAIIGFFFKKNRNNISKKKVKQTGEYLAKKLKKEGRILKDKVKSRIDASKTALEEVSN
ncbi:hypothetical protein [Aquiflexum gelatinilyticum]|uniref:Uncharacterized protein n=1 Tax=Aquiflexum gelatinilyticum TaxID=2961943 RepID=A0A9X2P9F7_9BACT|nr:hypothetical protein [Aquiflexum gelatinilyticum]MCR9015852.1 hypothetical protein [Aquiflexum gelatinilyticum]